MQQGGTQENFPISPRNGEVSEKAGFGIRGNRLSGPGKGWLLVSAVRLEATPQAVEMRLR